MILLVWQYLLFHYLEWILKLLPFLLIFFENKFIFPLLAHLLYAFRWLVRWNYETAICSLILGGSTWSVCVLDWSLLAAVGCTYTFCAELLVAGGVKDLIFWELHVGLGHFRNISFFNALEISDYFTFQVLLNQIHRFILLIFDQILENWLSF